MATSTTLIASSTVGSGGAANVTLSSIPSTYTDLKILASTQDSRGAVYGEFTIGYNGGYNAGSWRAVYANGTTPGSTSNGTTSYIGEDVGASGTANTFSNCEIYIPNYNGTASTKYISGDAVAESNTTTTVLVMTATTMTGSAAAITSLTFTPVSGSFTQYTSFYLYGIKNS